MTNLALGENKKVEYSSDGMHCWIDGEQWIAFSRFMEIRGSAAKEMELYFNKVKELEEENKALKVLLRDKLKLE